MRNEPRIWRNLSVWAGSAGLTDSSLYLYSQRVPQMVDGFVGALLAARICIR